MQDFRRLRVWERAFALALDVRRTSNSIRRGGYSELKAQTCASAESIVANIVEGCGATTPKEFARFLEIAIKSSMELEGHIDFLRGYDLVPVRGCDAMGKEVVETRKMLITLRKRVLASAGSRAISR